MRTFALIAVLVSSITASAGTPPTPAMLENLSSTPVGFEENKGQVRTTDGEAAPFVRYRLSEGNMHLFLLENGIAYQFSRLHYPQSTELAAPQARPDRVGAKQIGSGEEVRLETYRMDMVLEGSDPDARISTEGKSAYYLQYYNHDALHVHTYSRVTYHDIYPGIDWVVYTTAKGMKYDFVVRPGSDPARIRMRFEHHEELSVDADGNLIHGNRMGRFTEERPVSFQDGKPITTSFVLEGNTLRFEVANHDPSRTLIIDPARLWATYYGGTGVDFGWSCTTDASGNVYMAGSAESSNGIAAGGHQNTYAEFRDAFLAKFTAAGVRLWGTYYGGPSGDSGWQCAVDASGNVYMSGETTSATAIASGGHQNTIGGDADAFLVKFNAAGTRLWATYYGGTGYDRGLHCDVEPSGNVFLCGEAASSSGIASGGHQNTYGGGDRDGFLAKFSPTGTRLWGTYYGGNDYDTGQSCIVDPSGYILMCGQTNSAASIASSGHQNALGGGFDAFVAKFHSGGARVWASYYGGPAADDGWQCAVGTDGSVFLCGSTSSTSGISSGGHQNGYGGGVSDAFITKFNASGSRMWGSYYGGSAEDFAYSCAVDAAGSCYITGFTSSTTDIASNGHQNTYGGGESDTFLAKLAPEGGRAWGTYYGGTGGEGGFWEPTYFISGRCDVDQNGNVILTGNSTSTTAISFNGHQNTFGGERDAFLVKFEDRSIITGVINGPICTAQAVSVPFTVSGAFNAGNTFTAQLSNASGGFASPVNIGTLSGTGNGTINASIPIGTAPGTGYRIRVVGNNPIVEGTDNGTNLTINNPTTSCACADLTETEANNTAATANALAYDTPSSGITGPCSVADNTVDMFSFATSTQGLLRVQACLSNTGATSINVTFRVLSSSGSTLGTFILPAGANNAATPGEFLFPCRGITSYRIAVDNPSTTVCTNYALSYTILPPVFGNDPEPNDAIGATATPVAYNTDRDGRNNFDGETTYDYYSIVLPTNGILNIQAQAEHAGATESTMAVALLSSTGTVQQTWNVAVGANSTPVTSNVSITCRSTVNTYYIRINSAVCGTSYRFKYTVTPPLYAADIEPNNSVPGTLVVHDTYAEGQIQFDGENVNDYYNIVPPINGVMTINVEAEHVGASPATMDMGLYTTTGVLIQTWTVNVGANSTAAATTASITCRGNTTGYTLRFATTTCGVSYRWKYVMTAPLFANDVEPNNSNGGSTEDINTWYEGQIGFDATDDDIFNLVPSHNGVMHIEVEAEHTGATPGTVTMALLNASGTAIQTWTVAVGANGIALDTLVSVPCRSSTTNYNLRFSDVTCGVSYRWKYTMTAPHFANDVEPNNTNGGTTEVIDTWYEGQLGFDNQTDDDIYNLVPPFNGVMNIQVEAEHTGATPGTATVALLSATGTVIQSWTMTVGANSVPQATQVSVTCRSSITNYNLRFSDVTCGVSYRWKYTMTAPVFANDVEPNNAQPGTALAQDTYAEGQLAFDTENTYDFYRITLAANGRVNVELQAEHTGATAGTITVLLLSTTGATLQTWNFPVGANSVPITTILSKTCLNGATAYDLRLSSSVCGASYKLKYTLLPSVFAGDIEPNNTGAQAIVLPEAQPAQGYLNFNGDNLDMYRVDLSSDGMINVLIEAEHAGVETNGTITVALLYNNGSLAQTWTAPIGAGSIPISTTLNRTCLGNALHYYLRISSSICLTSYRVTYTVTPTAFGNDPEPNQSRSVAVNAVAGANNDGHVSFSYGNTFDYFRILAPNDGVLNLTILAEHAGTAPGTMTFYLRNTGDGIMETWTVNVGANSTPLSNTFSRTCIGTENVYYLEPYSPNLCGVSYRFIYTVAEPDFGDDLEPNQSRSVAINAPPNTPVDGRVSFDYDNTYDYFRILAPNDGVLNLTMEAEHAGATPGTMTLYMRDYGDGVLHSWTVNVGANGVPATNTFSHTCTGTETVYYLEPYSPSVCGVSYRFSWSVAAPVYADDTEPNQSRSVADPTAPNTPVDGRVSFEYDNTFDYFYVQAPNDGVMSVTILAEHAGPTPGTMTLYLRNSGDGILETWTVNVGANSTPVSNTFTRTCIGTEDEYYLETYSPNLCGVSYRIIYTVTEPSFGDDIEPNQSRSVANLTAPNTPMDGRIAFDYDNTYDYFYVQAPNDGVMNVTILAEHAGPTPGTMTLYLRNSGDGILETWTVNVGANSIPVSNTFMRNCIGTEDEYYLETFTPTVCGVSYRFSYSVTSPVYADDTEPNQSLSVANAIDLNAAPAFGRLTFNYDNDFDYFRVNHPGGQLRVITSAENAGAAGTMTVYIRNSGNGVIVTNAGVAVGGNGVPALDTTETLGALPAGIYYIETYSPSLCGVSYRLNCYDDDQDGTCNAVDLCAGGPEPGTPCDDDNSATNNDVIQANCSCSGTLVDSDCNGVPGGPALPGTACNDNNVCTTGDVFDANCNCSGIIADADGDGVCDANDDCANTPGGEGVNAEGCSCTQVVISDGDPCTADICVNGTVTHPFQDADNDGTCDANDLCPGGPEPGTACNDGDACTTGDVISANCLCAGTFADADEDGTCDVADLCPGGPEPGTACNDNNGATINDIIQENCQCAGTVPGNDCNGVPGGPAVPGTACNDNDDCTTGDVFDANCLCAGTFADADEDGTCDAGDVCPGGPEPGSVCDDGNAFTVGDIVTANCQCIGQTDADADGIADTVDNCPNTANADQADTDDDGIGDACDNCLSTANASQADTDDDGLGDECDSCPNTPGQINSPCNDNNASTTNDVIGANCICAGTPVSTCTQNLVIEFQLDANPGQISWEIRQQGSNGLVQGGPSTLGTLVAANGTQTVSTCVPNGCFYLRVIDSAGDGMVNGGYILRTSGSPGMRIIDNRRNFSNLAGGPPDVSQIAGGEGFCVPFGVTTQPIYTSCDKLDWVSNEYLVCSSVPAVSALWNSGNLPAEAITGYEFWFYNPNGGYSFRKFRDHASSDLFGPDNATRACHIRLNNWAVANQIPTGVLMNVRVRTRINGTYGQWGAACRLKVDPVQAACPLTNLMDIPGNPDLSCNSTRAWGNGNYIHARPVSGATQYQWRFRIDGESFISIRTTTTYFIQLNWATLPLQDGKTYTVEVRAFKNGAWCVDSTTPANCGFTNPCFIPWNPNRSCMLTIDNTPMNGGENMAMEGTDGSELVELRMYPNPNRGDQLYLSLDAIEEGVTTVSVDITDMFGKHVSARTIAVTDGSINTVLDLDGSMANGLYLVNISAGDKRFTQRLVIQP